MSTTQRIGQLAGHLDPRTWSGKGLAAAQLKNDNDVVIVAAGRTAQCKAKKGQFKDTPFDVLVFELFKGILGQANIDPKLLDDIVVGNVANANAAYIVRAAALAAGVPDTTPSLIVNRFCASGLMAIRTVANQIQAGEIDCGLAAGVESMTGHSPRDIKIDDEVTTASQQAADCQMPMGWTSENVAKDFGLSREEMDAFASRSHARASHAQKAGQFASEIFPVQAVVNNPDGSRSYKVVTEDDGIRHNTTPEGLAKIKPAFPQWSPGQTTGGNASQLTDGGAAVILIRRSLANKLGVKIIAKYAGCAVSGLEPRIMGIGPTFAIPKLLEQTGVKQEEVDLFEINEAFASMAVYSQRKLAIPDDRLNVYGGAIALGHPLGCSGARLVVTLLNGLKSRNQRVGVVSACIGTGMGAAGIFIRED